MLLYELLKYEYLKYKKYIKLKDILNINGEYLITLEHIFTKDNISLSFNDEDDLFNYLLNEIYDLEIYDIVNMNEEDINELQNNSNIDINDDITYKNYIIYEIYKKVKDSYLYDNNCFINKNIEIDNIHFENIPIDKTNLICYNYLDYNHINAISNGYNIGKTNLINKNLFYGLAFLDNITIKNYKDMNSINFMIENVNITKHENVYKLSLNLVIIEDNDKIYSIKIPNFSLFTDDNALTILHYILNLDDISFKLQVLMKLQSLDYIDIDYELDKKVISFYEFKRNLIIEFLKKVNVDFYIGNNYEIIDVNKAEYILVEYIKRSTSGNLSLELYREWLLLSYGLNLITFNNFLLLSKTIVDDFNKILTKS